MIHIGRAFFKGCTFCLALAMISGVSMAEPSSPSSILDEKRVCSLAIAAQKGDQQAYKQLLEMIYPAVSSFLKKRVSYLGISDDAIQEVLLAIHAGFHTYDPSRPFGAWMYSIARYKMIDLIRSKTKRSQRELTHSQLVEEALSEEGPEHPLLLNDCQKILAAIPESYREPFVLVKVEGMSTKEAATKLKISEGSLRTRLSRAYKLLQGEAERMS